MGDGDPVAAGGMDALDAPDRADAHDVFARRAATVFLLLAGVALIGLLLVLGFGRGQGRGLELAVAIGVTLASMVGCYLLSSALSTGRPWAPGLAVAVLWVVALAGIVDVVVALAAGRLTIPIDAVLAAWALSAANRPPVLLRGSVLGAVALTLVLVGPRFVEPLVAVARGWTATDQEDLRFALGSNCHGPADRTSGRVIVTVDWSWARTDPLADGPDAIELRWGDGDPLALAESDIVVPAGVNIVSWPDDGTGDNPALSVLVAEHPEGDVVRFALPRAAADDGGRITVPLDVTAAGPATVQFVARYARGTQWRIAEVTPCDLPLAATAP